MRPNDVLPFVQQVVEVQFADGERVLARILSVDQDVADNHIFYDVLEILEPGPSPHDLSRRIGFACSATEILSVVRGDNVRVSIEELERLTGCFCELELEDGFRAYVWVNGVDRTFLRHEVNVEVISIHSLGSLPDEDIPYDPFLVDAATVVRAVFQDNPGLGPEQPR